MYRIQCANSETSYNIEDFYNTNNASHATKHYAINPALTEVAVSTIAHHLFPDNFARYRFFNDTQNKMEADAGYTLQYDKAECGTHPIGVENVYATAFFLGLKIKSHFCIIKDEQTYLYIDDFARPLHRIDVDHGSLVDEYRGAKEIRGAKGVLFPNEFIDEECGVWIGVQCNQKKLKQAYKLILDKGTDDFEFCHIVNMAIMASQNIECQNNNLINDQNINCSLASYESELYEYFSERTHWTILHNYISIKDLYPTVEDWI